MDLSTLCLYQDQQKQGSSLALISMFSDESWAKNKLAFVCIQGQSVKYFSLMIVQFYNFLCLRAFFLSLYPIK